ncbi:TolB family protein [Salinilacustrithrix flava]|uniref:TolB family protein n=1 Tax=Salinilacustrithrix flava TaxID=2957203 RepID=UPI003D7C295F
MGRLRTLVRPLLCAATVVTVAACGGDDDPAPASSETTGATTTTAAPDDEQPDDEVGAGDTGDDRTVERDEEFLASLDGYLVFSSERDDPDDDSHDDLYQMRPDGSDVVRITDNERNDWWPQVVDDGGALLLGRDYPDESRSPRSGHSAWGIWLLDGSGDAVDLTDDNEFNSGPRLSPDGTRILFTSARDDSQGFDDAGLLQLGLTAVWVMERDGSDAQKLSDDGANAGAWSPDGSEIVFTAATERDGPSDIFVMAADGSDVRQVTDTDIDEARPDWSPDGTSIVFDADDGDGDTEIFVIGVDGSGLRQLTDNDTDDDFARWSHDGEAIAFTSDRDGNSEIYVMAADGSSQSNISADPALDIYPSWSEVPFG